MACDSCGILGPAPALDPVSLQTVSAPTTEPVSVVNASDCLTDVQAWVRGNVFLALLLAVIVGAILGKAR